VRWRRFNPETSFTPVSGDMLYTSENLGGGVGG
jgi:hypothetical protein